MPALILLGAEHGVSRQEALSLEWGDIDFDFQDKGLIKLFRNKNKKERTEYLMPRTKKRYKTGKLILNGCDIGNGSRLSTLILYFAD